MIIPSIDLAGGQTVQLVGGREPALEAGDPRPLAQRFGRLGEVAVIDLDAAIGTGEQAGLIKDLLPMAPCRVGGGIRSYEAARDWLDAGAVKIILGTAAEPALLRKLPRDRVIVALDAEHGEVVVEGWRRGTGARLEAKLVELRGYVDNFLITFVEREGRMGGVDLGAVEKLRGLAGEARLTVAGGVTTAEEIAALDQMGADAQVGMALYRGVLDLASAFAAPFVSDRSDGLWPTVVQDIAGGVLGLCYSSERSLREAIESGRGVYESRQRGLWIKGESSGATQELLSIRVDCDRDALMFRVRQGGDGFCHRATWTCFDGIGGEPVDLSSLVRRLGRGSGEKAQGSYTNRLLADAELLRAKLVEEAAELAEAKDPSHVAAEAGDLLYFASVALVRAGVDPAEVWSELGRRAMKVTRRPGDAKREEGQ